MLGEVRQFLCLFSCTGKKQTSDAFGHQFCFTSLSEHQLWVLPHCCWTSLCLLGGC